MPDKYIRINQKLHSIIKQESIHGHMTMKVLVELLLWAKLKKKLGSRVSKYPENRKP